MIYDNDADLSKLDGKTVAILGYGSQGHAHALNLKDSGVNVVVGLREDSSSAPKARGDGLEVLSVADAASRGDVVMILLPDEKQHDIWESEIKDGIAPGNLLIRRSGEYCTTLSPRMTDGTVGRRPSPRVRLRDPHAARGPRARRPDGRARRAHLPDDVLRLRRR